MVSKKQEVQNIINEHGVVVFSKSYCPYCKSTKNLLKQKGVDAYILELDEIDEGSDIQAALADLTGQRTVPNVFINQKHIGGNSDVQNEDKSGSLDKMLKEATAA